MALNSTEAVPQGFPDPNDFLRARDLLLAADYTQQGFRRTLGRASLLGLRPVDVPAALRRTAGGPPQHVLIRLFLIGARVERDAVANALMPTSLQSWVDAGFIAVDGDHARATVKILPVDGLVLLSDPQWRLEQEARHDYVMGVGKSSLLVANVAVRRPCRRALDLGTGCGLLALRAASHSSHVYATDKNPRAVQLTRLNARLNDVHNVTALAGDLFDPVANQTFDLILSNPPFVISPAAGLLYRDSGMRGDALCHTIIRDAPRLLADGGFCQTTGNWAHYAGQPWQERLASWFAGIGCDALVWHHEVLPVEKYACRWIQDAEATATDRFTAQFDQWMTYFEEEGIEAVGGGLIMLRRRTPLAGQPPNWLCFEEAPEAFNGWSGDHVLCRFAAEDLLRSITNDRELMQLPIRLSAHVRIDQTSRPVDGHLVVDQVRLRREHGPAYSATIDGNIARLIAHCVRPTTTDAVFRTIAEQMDVRYEALAPAGLEIVRRLIQQGYLIPQGIEEPQPPTD